MRTNLPTYVKFREEPRNLARDNRSIQKDARQVWGGLNRTVTALRQVVFGGHVFSSPARARRLQAYRRQGAHERQYLVTTRAREPGRYTRFVSAFDVKLAQAVNSYPNAAFKKGRASDVLLSVILRVGGRS